MSVSKVTILTSMSSEDLERSVHTFLNNNTITVVDIKYTVAVINQYKREYSVLIWYNRRSE